MCNNYCIIFIVTVNMVKDDKCDEFLNIIKNTLDEDVSKIHVVVILGASVSSFWILTMVCLKGDLAKKKTYPSLWYVVDYG